VLRKNRSWRVLKASWWPLGDLKSFGDRTNMVYYNRPYDKCHVCQICKPFTWFRCVICGVWMGMHCNPPQLPLPTGDDDVDDARTSEVKLRSQRADLCSSCCINKISNKIFERELPILVQRRALKCVSYGSWW